MSARGARWDTTTLLVIAGTAVTWVVGGLLICGAFGSAAESPGELLVILAALKTVLLVIRNWMYKLEVATMHGYHAGYHRAMQTRCSPGSSQCDVLDMAEVRARRLSQFN